MDVDKQKKLESLRYIPILGGIVLIPLGLLLTRGDQRLILSALVAMPVVLGTVLVALGVASIKLRRVLYSQEERIQRLEAKLLDRAGKSEQQES